MVETMEHCRELSCHFVESEAAGANILQHVVKMDHRSRREKRSWGQDPLE